MPIVNPLLARFAADLNDAYDKVCEDPAHEEFFRIFEGVSIRLFTVDGLTAKFWEEGIEFYPKEDS
jgi:hypothetical protein